LTVHHRAGNPKAGGAPFDYPILGGPGFESSFQTALVQEPPEALDVEPFKESYCVVPVLKGKSLKASRRRLIRSGCSLGQVIRKEGITAKSSKVFRQKPRAGVVLDPGGSVSVKLN
jgi:hypothetical protein